MYVAKMKVRIGSNLGQFPEQVGHSNYACIALFIEKFGRGGSEEKRG